MRNLMLVVVVALACSEGTEPTTVFVIEQASLDIVSGAGQTDTVGKELTTPVRIRVTAPVEGRAGETAPVPGQIVNFVVTAGGGTVFAGATITNDSGIAREIWTLGPTAGEQRIEARAVDTATGAPIVFATVTATAVPGPPDTLKLSVPTLRVTVGSTYAMRNLVTRAADRFGNAISNPLISVLATGGWTVAGDTVGSPTERTGMVTVRAGNARDSLLVRALRDISGTTWSISYACFDSPVSMRGAESPPIGVDSAIATGVVDSISFLPDVEGSTAPLHIDRGTLHYTSDHIVYWRDGVVDTVVGDRNSLFVRQRPDSLIYGTLGGQGVGLWQPQSSTYVGGDACSSSFEQPPRPVVLTGG